jgi:hypothetical protein
LKKGSTESHVTALEGFYRFLVNPSEASLPDLPPPAVKGNPYKEGLQFGCSFAKLLHVERNISQYLFKLSWHKWTRICSKTENDVGKRQLRLLFRAANSAFSCKSRTLSKVFYHWQAKPSFPRSSLVMTLLSIFSRRVRRPFMILKSIPKQSPELLLFHFRRRGLRLLKASFGLWRFYVDKSTLSYFKHRQSIKSKFKTHQAKAITLILHFRTKQRRMLLVSYLSTWHQQLFTRPPQSFLPLDVSPEPKPSALIHELAAFEDAEMQAKMKLELLELLAVTLDLY